MKILLTGRSGFIGKNLHSRLSTRNNVDLITFGHSESMTDLTEMLKTVDWVIHLGGVNRPSNKHDFITGNYQFTKLLCEAIKKTGKIIPIIFSSSIQAKEENLYGKSKKLAEESLLNFQQKSANPVYIYRLPNVFGKWAMPNYNSVVATFCYNIINNIAVDIHDPKSLIRLVYVEDVIDSFIKIIDQKKTSETFIEINPEYKMTVKELFDQLNFFQETRGQLEVDRVGSGLVGALYSTFVSYLQPYNFSYSVPRHDDNRGVFVEMLKTADSGQLSFFTAFPGVTRGGHYHHNKTEKFLVIKGKAKFRFKHILTNETYEIYVSGKKSEIVETIPGWAHDITNIGNNELICMLWANEIFDHDRPDTFSFLFEKVKK